MKSTKKQLLKRNKSILKINFLQKMMNKNLGTNKVESVAETLVRDTGKEGRVKEEKKRTYVKTIMNLKVKDAEESVNVENHKYHQSKKSSQQIHQREHLQEIPEDLHHSRRRRVEGGEEEA